MSSNEQPPADSPTGVTLDELDHRHIEETKTPKSLLYGGIAALVVAVVVAFLINNHIQNKRAAAQALGSASTEEELQAVVSEHAGTVSAGTALVELSNQQIADERYEEALSTLNNFLDKYEDHPLGDRALIAKASTLGRMDRESDALAALDQFNAEYNDSPFANLATLLRGDIEKKSGNTEAAMAAYTIVASSDTDGTGLAQVADSRERFINYTAPREVEPAPEPELPENGNLPPASTGDPELDALINDIDLGTEEATADESSEDAGTTEANDEADTSESADDATEEAAPAEDAAAEGESSDEAAE